MPQTDIIDAMLLNIFIVKFGIFGRAEIGVSLPLDRVTFVHPV